MKVRGFEEVTEQKRMGKDVLLPLRGTKTSAGYDFYTPIDLVIKPQETVFFWTDVKAYMQEGEVLLLDVRSSLGIKHDLMLANTIPVIDSDYYNNTENGGNIGICLRNLKPKLHLAGYDMPYVHTPNGVIKINVPVLVDLSGQNTVHIKAGERVVQGIFLKYLESDNCNTDATREGGIGSTSKGGHNDV